MNINPVIKPILVVEDECATLTHANGTVPVSKDAQPLLDLAKLARGTIVPILTKPECVVIRNADRDF